jgi:hypothetical protein
VPLAGVGAESCGLPPFSRGESSCDGVLNISDPVHTLGWLFSGLSRPCCLAAADASGQGTVNISSPVYTLAFLFLGGPLPPPPFRRCEATRLESDTAVGCEVSTCR